MSITLKTKNWKWEIEDNGINKSITVGGKEQNICKENQYFAFISLPGIKCVPKRGNDKSVFPGEESLVYPKKLSREGNILTVEFENPKVVFTMEMEEKEVGIIFRLKNVEPSDYNYGRFFFAYHELENNGDIYSSGITHNIELQAVEEPGYCVRGGAYTTKILGDKDKACEIVICKKEDMRQNIKDICGKQSINDVVVTRKGGAFSDECDGVTYNYAEVSGENLYDLDKFLEPHKHLNINMFDIRHGYVFRQGDMTFLLGSMEKFRTEFVDKLHERGMKVGLHIYGCMIADDSPYLTPIPHKDLVAMDYYTLRDDLSEDANELFIEEDTDKVEMIQGYCERKTCCFGIDDEIIVFEKRGENGRIYNLERGAFGTKISAHKKGAEIKHFIRDFTHFHPMPGSELYYEIARNAARLYNEGNFDYIFVDGLDVPHCMYDPKRIHWLPETEYETKWYYSARFVQEILKYCEKEPMLEYSMTCPAYWAARSREGTFDTFFTSYKKGIDFHCRQNEIIAHNKLLSSQLGWYDFYPMAFEYGTPYFSTYITSYEFPEDVEYMGQKVVAFDSAISSMSYDAKKYPQMDRKRYENEKLLAPYTKAKESKYFSQDVKDMLKSEDHRYRICEKDDEYSFYEIERHFGYPYSFKENENSFEATNRFNDQKPFVRLLCMHTAEETNDDIVLAKFDKNISVNEQETYFDLKPSKDECLDLTGHEAIGVWVKGNNSDEYMSIGLVGNLASKVFLQSVVHLNFEGWRYFTLCEKDGNEYAEINFNYKGKAGEFFENSIAHSYHAFLQPTPCLDKTFALIVGFSGEGKDVCIGDIKAIKPKKESIKNPYFEIDGEKVTFMCELQPSEYIEYKGGEKADVLDVTGKVREADAIGTHPTMKKGENIVYIGAEGNGVRRIKTYIITEDK